jgi:ABC-2 type transport system permease protein
MVLSVLAVLLSLLHQLTLCVCALWIYEASPPFWIYQKLSFLLGGMLLPLDYYPSWLREIAFATPFAVMFYGPASIILHPELDHAVRIFLFQLLWLLASVLTLSLVANSGIRHAVQTGKGS